MNNNFKKSAEKLLYCADIIINGDRPWDIQVKNDNFYKKVIVGGSLSLGETYVDGWWDCESVDELIYRLLKAHLENKIKFSPYLLLQVLKAKIFNNQTINKSKKVGESHYDLGNDLYGIMLDERMNYSCGYWKEAGNLDEAQYKKLDLICRKLKLKSGMSLLDIGCGWGALAKFVAQNYKVKVFGITISKEQFCLTQKNCQNLNVQVKLMDYRELNKKYDRVVSVGMFEHVGRKNYKTFFETVDRCLEKDGLFLLHTIGAKKTKTISDPWIEKYIFPNGLIPSAKQITQASERYLKLEDWHNFGTYYDQTLMAWYHNFNSNWDKIKTNYDDRFRRMWNYYLLCCAATFRARHNQLWQIVFTKNSFDKHYPSER